MKKIKLEISYDGSRYFGWQRQTEDMITVQGELEKALQKIFRNKKITTCASGRTDAGVHAYAQVAHAWVPENASEIPLLRGLNGLIPKDISVHSVDIVSDDFHAIASSEKKTYIYKVYNSPVPFALNSKYKLWVRKPIDLQQLNDWAGEFVGTHDFKSFMTSGSPVPSTVRTVFSTNWRYIDSTKKNIEFEISGNGFLKQMVRNIVGTLLYMQEKELDKAHLKKIIAARDRRKSYRSAPAHGLYLKSVLYPESVVRSIKSLS